TRGGPGWPGLGPPNWGGRALPRPAVGRRYCMTGLADARDPGKQSGRAGRLAPRAASGGLPAGRNNSAPPDSPPWRCRSPRSGFTLTPPSPTADAVTAHSPHVRGWIMTEPHVPDGGESASSTSANLLARAVARDPRAWERLVALYAPLILGWCRRWGLRLED